MSTLWCSHWVHRPHPPTPIKPDVRPCRCSAWRWLPGPAWRKLHTHKLQEEGAWQLEEERARPREDARHRRLRAHAPEQKKVSRSGNAHKQPRLKQPHQPARCGRVRGARAAARARVRRPLAPRGGVVLCPPLEEDARAGLRRALERAHQGLVAVVVAARLLPGERHVRRREQLSRAAGAPVGPPRRRHSPQRSPVVVGRGAQIAKCQASSRVKAFTRKNEF